MYALYSLALAVLLTVAAPYYLWKGRGSGRYLRTLGERLGNVPASVANGQPSIWVHAVSVGEVISLKEKARLLPTVVSSMDSHARRQPQHWLETKHEAFEGRMLALPAREDIPVQVNEQMIVELYSK